MPQQNWQGFNESLGSLAQVFLEKKQKKQQMQQALQMMIMEAQIKAQYDPEAQFRQQILGMLQGGGQGGGQPPINLGGNLGGGMPMPNGRGMGGQGIAPQGLGGGMQPRLKGFNVGGMNIEFPQSPEEVQQGIQNKVRETQAIELGKGIPTAETGKVALARESIKNIQDVKSMLFPKGTAQSYRRDIAAGSNLPLSGLPGVPSNLGLYSPQTVFRKVGAAISGRQLIQTGVAARPEETLKLIRQFAPSGLTSSKAALDGLNELQKFYEDYLYLLETKGLQSAEEWASSKKNQQPSSLNSMKSKWGLK